MAEAGKHVDTWVIVCRALGIAMLAILFLAFIILEAIGRPLDRAEVLAFLSVITVLLGLPSGYQIVKKINGDK